MNKRVVCIPLTLLGKLSPSLYEELGRSRDAWWASMSDDPLLATKEQYPQISLIYFSVSDYESAIRGLSSNEVEEVIRKRLNQWAPSAEQAYFDRLYRNEQQCLTLTAIYRSICSPKMSRTLETHFEETIETLDAILGEGRYGNIAVVNLLRVTLEHDVKLMDEIEEAVEELKDAGDTTLLDRFAAEIETRKQYAQELGIALEKRGRPGFVGSLPHTGLLRACWVWPRDEGLMQALELGESPFTEWRDGVVSVWRLRDLPSLEARGKSVVLIYRYAALFTVDERTLTRPQLEREFEQRMVTYEKQPKGIITEHLNEVRLGNILLKKSLVARARSEDPSLAQVTERQLAGQIAAFRSALAADSPWLDGSIPDLDQLPARLEQAENDIYLDATLFSELSRLNNAVDIRSRFLSLLGIKEEQLKRIASLIADEKE